MRSITDKVLEERKSAFIAKAKSKYGDYYDYSKINYIDLRTHVTIICPKHGEFRQTPAGHLASKCPCLKCSYEQRAKDKTKTTEQFIEAARKKHGDKYDYSLVDYKGNDKYVEIKCNSCGHVFKQVPSSHLDGCGCPYCGRERTLQTTRMTLEEFTRRSKEKFGDDAFDYSKVVYKNNRTKVILTCKKCGYVFEQEPLHHLNGIGCPKCNHQIKFTTEYFIERAKEKHGDLYDYSKVDVKDGRTPVLIHCNRCGQDFWQSPCYHLKGHGCRKCSRSHLEENMAAALKENNIQYEEQKMFDWMGTQRLDFYLPDYNIAIECQGGQHLISVERFGGIETLKYTLDCDKRKYNACKEHGIKIIYFTNFTHKFPYPIYRNIDILINDLKNDELMDCQANDDIFDAILLKEEAKITCEK